MRPQIVSGLQKYAHLDQMQQYKVAVLCNLNLAKMRDVLESGMVCKDCIDRLRIESRLPGAVVAVLGLLHGRLALEKVPEMPEVQRSHLRGGALVAEADGLVE